MRVRKGRVGSVGGRRGLLEEAGGAVAFEMGGEEVIVGGRGGR